MKKYLLLFTSLIISTFVFAQQGKVRLGMNFGYSYRTAELAGNIPNDLKSYAEDLKSGTTLDFNLGYNVKEIWGLGVTFSQFHSKNSITSDNLQFFDISGNQIRNTSDNIKITFIAPEFYSILPIGGNEKHLFLGSVSIGYLGYNNKSTIGNASVDFEGSTVGFGVNLGYEFKITPIIAIGANAGFITGSLSEFKISGGGESRTISVEDATLGAQERENLSRINLSFGLKFYL